MNPPNEQQVDHSKRSREWLEQAEARRVDNETEAMTDLFFAEAHASVAMAEQLERIGDELVQRRHREEEQKCQI